MTEVTGSSAPQGELVFVKLGGSLITDKRSVETPRPPVIERLAAEIAAACAARPHLCLVIGHGSGSFGHVVGNRYGTRQGVHTPADWYGFALTADMAARLNRLVARALLEAGVAAWSIQPSVMLRAVGGRLVAGPDETVRQALAQGLTPLVYGDVALDYVQGGTIASTEEIFDWLVPRLQPRRLILAGEVEGVFTADPQLDRAAQLIPVVTPATLAAVQTQLGGSHGIDVTGGMAAKVAQAVQMVVRHPELSVTVCSGLVSGRLLAALTTPQAAPGTLIRSD